MESLIESGFIDAVADITTTEWADELVGGYYQLGLPGWMLQLKKGYHKLFL